MSAPTGGERFPAGSDRSDPNVRANVERIKAELEAANPGQTVVVAGGDEAMSKMIDVWLVGFLSGAASVFANVELPDDVGEQIAKSMVRQLANDPLEVEAIRGSVSGVMTASCRCAITGAHHDDHPDGEGS